MQAALRLPLSFDATALEDDLARIERQIWTPHFNARDYDGDWSGLALRGPAEATHPILALSSPPGQVAFEDQPILRDCPAICRVIARLQCPLGSVRLLRLGAGAEIKEHTDHELNFEHGEARLHVPIRTGLHIDFRAVGQRVIMQPGELWYLDASRPHSVRNTGAEDRVHLVLDCRVNDWLRSVFEGALAEQVDLTPADLTDRMIGFVREIGLRVEVTDLNGATFLPGLRVEDGALHIDLSKLEYPGDILHEAGHLAALSGSERRRAGDDDLHNPGHEMMAIAWSWAAAQHLGVPDDVLFHTGGYKGDATWLADAFQAGQYVGLPMLEWAELTIGSARSQEDGVAPYPAMQKWLRD